jgi:nitroreductase
MAGSGRAARQTPIQKQPTQAHRRHLMEDLMSSSLAITPLEQALHDAAARATLAPSVHNTQPWHFIVRADRLDVCADRRRRVPVVDPTGRQLILSCGAAVFGARAALASARVEAVTTLLPNAYDPDLLASITAVASTNAGDAGLDEDARRLDSAADLRHSNRRRFSSDEVPDAVLDGLAFAAEVEGAWLHIVRELDDRVALATLTQRADAAQTADPAYLTELLAWTSDDPTRRDGVPAGSIPLAAGPSHDDIPIRDFDTHGDGGLPTDTRSSLNQTLLVLGTAGDTSRDWLLAGQALGRVLLALTSAGFVASIVSQVIEDPTTRQLLRHELRLSGNPQLVLRVGVAEPTPPTPRLPSAEVITTDAREPA